MCSRARRPAAWSTRAPAPRPSSTTPPTTAPKRIAVVGAGPAGLACATVAAERGHQVTLFDGATEIGGQFNLAKQIPGKEEFHETIRYFGKRLRAHRRRAAAGRRAWTPRRCWPAATTRSCWPPASARARSTSPGADHAKVVSYLDVLSGRVVPGARVAIIGAGGIGFDVGRVSWPTTARSSDHRHRALDGRMGRVARLHRPRRPGQARARGAGARAVAAAAQPGQARRASWARPPAGSTARRSRPRACRPGAAWSTWAWTTPACGSAWTAANSCCPSTTWWSAPARSRCAQLVEPLHGRRPDAASDRRRRRRGRARRQARHRPGQPPRRRFLRAPRPGCKTPGLSNYSK